MTTAVMADEASKELSISESVFQQFDAARLNAEALLEFPDRFPESMEQACDVQTHSLAGLL